VIINRSTSWQIAKPFLEALTNTSAIIFDVPGIGGSPLPPLPIANSSEVCGAQLGHQ
jgi:hypothetical protein